ncbi:MAG: hypothetical protein K2H60_01050 [Muribaculaceae bacterium]|nr:hypothetical protein [Muribaculaceae bacterium]
MISSLTFSNLLKSRGSHVRRSVALIALGVLTVALGGCSAIHEDFPDCAPQQPDDVVKPVILRLSVDTGKEQRATRADKDPDDYQGADGSNFEKIESLRVLIIHELNSNKTEGVVEANRLVATTDDGIPLYDNLNFEVLPNQLKRIYLIANETYITPPSDSPSDMTSSRFLDTFHVGEKVDLTPLAKWIVWFPGTSSLTPVGTTVTTGLFSPSSDRRLPLTEFFDIDVKESDTKDDIFDAGLFLTRAAAKARFYINTGENFPAIDAENPVVAPTITAITLSGVGTGEYLFPNNVEYSIVEDNTTRIIDKDEIWEWAAGNHNPLQGPFITSFKGPEDSRPVTYRISSLMNNTIEKLTEPKVLHSNPIYFPESVLKLGEQFRVGVQINGREWLYAPLETNILDMAGVDAIARDTYLPITITFNGTADISVSVLPWNREDYYIDYSANIGFNADDYLKFNGTSGQGGDYLDLNRETGQLVLNYGSAAPGEFYIPSPQGSTWDAYLIFTGGIQDAIQFQIPDPDDSEKTITTTHISGIVGQDKAEFGIVATVAPGAVANTAELMVIVTLANGTPVVADVIGNWPCKDNDVQRLTVIENPQ